MIGSVSALHTVFEPVELGRVVGAAWGLAAPVSCRLLTRGVNDTYLVKSGKGRYALRVYRQGWRTNEEIGFELEVLARADAAGLPVAVAVPTPRGRSWELVSAAEGDRQLVLFRYAPGTPPVFPPATGTYHLLGELTASLHDRLSTAVAGETTRMLDSGTLLDAPLRLIETCPDVPSAARKAVIATVHDVSGKVQSSSSRWQQGVCHGDIGIGNIHVDEKGAVSLLDFDSCGVGWLPYDLAVFRWWAVAHQAGELPWRQFLEGYRSVRLFSAADEAAIPLLVLVRQIWVLGLQIALAPALGSTYLDTEAWPQAMRIIRAWRPIAGLPPLSAEVGAVTDA